MSYLPEPDRQYLTSKGIIFEEMEGDGRKAVVLKERPLPANRYDAKVVDVLILLPSSYPDVGPDMFYVLPWIKIFPANRFPNAADQPLDFGGQRWQRWSRHNNEWRPGIDGMRTMLKRVEHALESAV